MNTGNDIEAPLGRAERGESLADQTYRLVKGWMLNGGVRAGTKVTERSLAATLGVSRTPLREVLRLLENERLLERTERGQLIVATLSPTDIRQIHQCRMRIETLAAREAATNATKADIELLRNSVDQAWDAYQRGRDDILVMCNADFHEGIYEAARNPWLKLIATPLQNQMLRIRIQLTTAHHSPVWHDEHEAVVAAIEQRDADLAEQAMARHIESDRELHLLAAVDAGEVQADIPGVES